MTSSMVAATEGVRRVASVSDSESESEVVDDIGRVKGEREGAVTSGICIDKQRNILEGR